MGDAKAVTEDLDFLQDWYLAQCDGEWEHIYGVEIGSLDNPGWWLLVPLTETPLEGRLLEYRILNDDQDDWVHCWSKGDRFEAATGPKGLVLALQQFRLFVGSTTAADALTADKPISD